MNRVTQISAVILTLIFATLLFALPGVTQQITGVPGSSSATTTIKGEQLPPPPQKFGGKIERNAAQSTPWWPPRVVPNLLLIMTDDSGYGVPSTFGGVIPTPALDRPKLMPEDIKKLEAGLRNNKARE